MASTMAVLTPATELDALDTESKAGDNDVEEKSPAAIVEADSEPAPSELRAWLVVLGTFASNAATMGLQGSFGSWQDRYSSRELADHTQDQIAWIGSVQLFFMLATGIVSGRALDAGYLRPCLAAGSAMLVVCIIGQSFCTTYVQFLIVQGGLQGIGAGLVFTPAYSAPFAWFTKRRGLAIGVLSAGGGIGGIAWSLLLERLFQNDSVSFRTTCQIFAAAIAACLAVTLIFTRARRPPSPDRVKLPLLDVHPLRDRTYTVFTLSAFTTGLGLWLPFFFAPRFARSIGEDQSFALLSVTYLNAAAVVGRLAGCFLADPCGAVNCFIVQLLGCAVLLFAWPSVSSTAGFLTWVVIYGVFGGAGISGVPAGLGSISRHHMHELGQRAGLMFSFESLSALIGPPIGGAILGSAGFRGLSIWGGVSFLAAAALAMLSQVIFRRRVRHWRV